MPLIPSLTTAGGLCGSSYLNEYFREHLIKLLQNQTQLEVNGVTIRGLVEHIMVKIETTHKRCWDIYLNKKKLSLFVSGNLKPGKGLKGNCVIISAQVYFLFLIKCSFTLTVRRKDIEAMFLRLFVQIGDILENQIIPASNYGYNVDVGLKLFQVTVIILTQWYTEGHPDGRFRWLPFPAEMVGKVSRGSVREPRASSHQAIPARRTREVRISTYSSAHDTDAEMQEDGGECRLPGRHPSSP
jgi:hypothetical protein